jgi:NADH-quinone oxidoreductase subunit L
MHAMGGVIDMRRIGGLRKALPITHLTFACGAFALAGLPPLSGFWSKDEILAVASEAGHGEVFAAIYQIILISLLVTALLTAFYTSRAYFRTFWGEEKIPSEAGSHGHDDDHHSEHHGPGVAHESPPVMTVPLIVLAVGAVFVGGALAVTHLFGHFVSTTPDFVKYFAAHEEHANYFLMGMSTVLAVVGIIGAYFVYVARPGTAYSLSQNRFYFDEIYAVIAAGPMTALAIISKVFDMLIDGIVDMVGRLPRLFGGLLRPIQNGLVQFYALAMLLALAVFIGLLAFAR